MRLRKQSSERSVETSRPEPAPEFANLTVDLLKPVQHSKRYAITNVDSLGVIERFTYTEITREAARWAQLLREKGLKPGDRVVIVAGREWGWRCALLGAIHAGGVAVPCPDALSLREIRTVADHAGGSLLVALRPRSDLVELDGLSALTADDVDAVDPARALQQPPHRTESRDIALILYAWHGLDLTGTMHTHASLLAQADTADHWLGLDADERIWATADDGSGPSIWLLLAAWRRGASIVVVDLELDSEAKLELLDRLRPAAVWFSDDEYGMLGSADVPPWVDLRSIRRALVDTEETEGASSFVAAFGAALVPVFALDELGVVAGWPAGREGQADATTAHPTPGVQVAVVGGDGTELPPGEVGDVAVRSDAPTLFTGYAGREGRSRSAGWFRFGWRGALTAEGALRLEARSPSEVEPVGASVDLPVPEVAEEPEPEEHVAPEPEPAAIGWRARRSAERARREEEHAAEEERRRREEAEARENAEREAAEAAERDRAEAAERERAEAEARERAEREAAAAEERREREEAEARERAEREAAAEAQRAEDERLAEQRRVEAQQKQRDEEQRQRVEEDARRRAEQEEKQRAAAEAEERRRVEAEAKQRAEEEKEAREQEAREAKEREKAEADERRRAEEEAKAQQAVAAAEAKQRAEAEKSREKERQREEKEARARAEREAKEREKAEAEERRRAAEEAKLQAKRDAAEAKQRAKEEKEREQREARERAEREKADAEAAKVQAKIDAAEAKQRAKQEKEREKREAAERVEREKAAAAAAKVQAKIDAAEAKQRAKDDKEREKREAVERAEREKAEAEAAKARQKQAEIDAKKRAEEEKRDAKEREREAKEARRRAEEEAKEAARAERRAAREEKRRPPEAPKPAHDGQRRFGRRRREVAEEPEPQRAPDVVARIKQYGMAAESNGPAEPPEQSDDE